MISYAALAATLPLVPAAAQQAAPSADESGNSQPSDPAQAKPKPTGGDIVITGRRLDIARDAITPSLGASQYTFNREALEKQPGGTNLSLNKSLLQAPESLRTVTARSTSATSMRTCSIA